ncbi:MAG: BREX system P-loop protein BrxC, partial [Dehalococcoidia bacterium]
VRVMLRDTDVETVVRKVVLQKRSDRISELRAALDRASGEIDRHLSETRIGSRSTDRDDLVADYPLLPTRRRFWEAVLRAVDSGGRAGQLRTQLRVVHEATRLIAERPLGWVVPADSIYSQLETDMQQSTVLLRETATLIKQLDDGTDAGRLRSRLCGTIFLIEKLPTSGPIPSGVRATAATLADLLVEDLNAGSAELRRRIPDLLVKLVDDGRLMQIGEEYRLQTQQGAEWEADFRQQLGRFQGDDSRIAEMRAEELRPAIEKVLRGVALRQGKSAVSRKLQPVYGTEPPVTFDAVPVWVRDGWTTSERSVKEEAQTAGTESPIVYIFLPGRDADAVRQALASYHAAKDCVEGRPQLATDEGRQARQAMRLRAETERGRLDGLIGDVLEGGRVFQGGGAEVSGGSLQDSVKVAAEAALVRLFPRFDIADDPGWDKVFTRVRQGAGEALVEVGHHDDVEKHPVCQDLRRFLGTDGKRGSEVRRHFLAPPYGWSQDAVDGALLVLVAAGLVRASRNGQPVSARQLDHTEISGTEFRIEGVTVSTLQRIAVRQLLTEGELAPQPDQEGELLPMLLSRLMDLASYAGGEPPLPERPSTEILSDLLTRRGNDQIVAVFEQRDQLRNWLQAWSAASERIGQRRPRWELLLALLRQAERDRETATAAEPIRAQVEAIRAQRSLLEDPDPVAPLLDQLTSILRNVLQTMREDLATAQQQQIGTLQDSEEWRRLPENARNDLLAAQALGPVPGLSVGSAEELLKTLEERPLPDWGNRLAALPGRLVAAREAAAKRLEPQAVSLRPPHATLKTEQDLDDYLARLRSTIMAEIDAGRPVLI